MDKVYILKEDLNKWIARHLPNRDLISIDDLLNTIEDMDDTINDLNEELTRLKEYIGADDEPARNEYYNEERDREIEVLGNE